MPSSKKRSPLALIGFVLCLILTLEAASVLFTRVSTFDFLRRQDYLSAKRDGNIDTVFIGNSTCIRSINPNIINERCNTKNVMLAALSAQRYSFLGLVEEALTCHPQNVVVCYEYVCSDEAPAVSIPVSQFISSPLRQIKYTLTEAHRYKNYFDRLFPWRFLPLRYSSDMKSSIQSVFQPEKLYSELYGMSMTDNTNHVVSTYVKGGYLSAVGDGNWQLNGLSGAAYPKLPEPPDFAEYLKMQALCEKNGARLIVINTQEHIVRKLGQANYYGSTQYAADFFREHQIPFYDFDYIRPERMPDLSNTMFDFCHMKDEGATIFSQTLATLLEEIKSGKDVGNWFMTRDEYLKTVDFIPNVWICDISEKKDDEAVYEADCNRGSQVVPEYRFVLVAEDGAETTVQDWSENPLYITQKGTLNGQILRVYARSQGTAENAQTVSYDFK